MPFCAHELRSRLAIVAVVLQFVCLRAAFGQETDATGAWADPDTGLNAKFGQVIVEDLPTPLRTEKLGRAKEPSMVELSAETLAGRVRQPLTTRLKSIQFDGVALSDAMKLFAMQTGLNVICSAESGKTVITVYLRDVEPLAALEAIVKANGLFFRVDEASGIVRIATADEYEKDLTSFREEQTRVFTLLYPNPIAVAQVISQVYGRRVDSNTADADQEEFADLSQRFNRFDLVDGRALGLGTFDGGGQAGGVGGNNNAARLGIAGQQNIFANGGITDRSRSRSGHGLKSYQEDLSSLSAAEIQDIENQTAIAGGLGVEERARLVHRGKPSIYVSTIRRNNQIVVRTADMQSMAEIEQLVRELDVPTPTVLLEVKVLRINLADGMTSSFEFFGGGEPGGAAFSDGVLLPSFPGANSTGTALAHGLGVAGSLPGALTFQLVDSNFRFRMQLLESQSRVTALATPLILTANNEVSRIFVGDTLPFTIGFAPSRVVAGANAVASSSAATPITELRDVGQSLLITPNINADRTVTLRVVEENSERILGGGSIPVPDVTGGGVTVVKVDTVRRRTVSGTIVAQDGMAVALGGMIEETISDSRDQIPILGNIPGLGFLFRRQASVNARSELVVVIRPYVFNTPSESAATSQMLLGNLSVHPSSPDAIGTMGTYSPGVACESGPACHHRASLFRFHTLQKPSDAAVQIGWE